jgi:hypothetical protein
MNKGQFKWSTYKLKSANEKSYLETPNSEEPVIRAVFYDGTEENKKKVEYLTPERKDLPVEIPLYVVEQPFFHSPRVFNYVLKDEFEEKYAPFDAKGILSGGLCVK